MAGTEMFVGLVVSRITALAFLLTTRSTSLSTAVGVGAGLVVVTLGNGIWPTTLAGLVLPPGYYPSHSEEL